MNALYELREYIDNQMYEKGRQGCYSPIYHLCYSMVLTKLNELLRIEIANSLTEAGY